MYKEVARWSTCGQGPVEQKILETVNVGEVKQMKGSVINELIRLRNKDAFGEPIAFQAEPKETYLLYYNFHSSSGYQTIFDDNGSYEILPPKNGVLCAFFSEAVILKEVGKIIEFKRK